MYLSPSKYHSKGSSGFSSTSIAEVSGNFGGSVEGKMIVAWFCICVRWYMMWKLWSHVDTSCQYFQCVLRVLGVFAKGFSLRKAISCLTLICRFQILDILLTIWIFHPQSTKEILKVLCSKDFKGIFLPKTFLPSAAALEIFCKKLLDRCKHPHRGRALKRDEYIWISQRAAEQIAETREAQEAGKENVRTEKLAGGFLFKIKCFTMDLF